MLKSELKKIYKSPLLLSLLIGVFVISFLVFFMLKNYESDSINSESDNIYSIIRFASSVFQITILPLCFILSFFSFQLEHKSLFFQNMLFKKINVKRFFIFKVFVFNALFLSCAVILLLILYNLYQNKFSFSDIFMQKFFVSFGPIFLLSWVHFMFLSSVFLYIKNTPIGLGIVALYSFLTNFDLPYNIFFFMNKACTLTYPIFYSNFSLKFNIDNFVLNAVYTLILSIMMYYYWYKKYRFKIS
jgi:hypothetical protein